MFAAVDAPKSKQITIAYLSLKTTSISWLLLSTLAGEGQACRAVTQAEVYSLFILFYKLGFILDLVSILYFLLRDEFSRLQFYVYYFLHLTSIIVMGFTLLLVPTQEFDSSCPVFPWVRQGCFFLRILFFFNSVGIMWMNLFPALRLAHCGANLSWSLLWLIADADTKENTRILGLSHGIMSLAGVAVLGLVEALGKIKLSVIIWRYSIKLNIFGLFLVWIYSLTAPADDQEAKGLYLYNNAYAKLGLGEILSPLLYLVFMNIEQGDPRQPLMAVYADIFVEGRESCKLKYEEVY